MSKICVLDRDYSTPALCSNNERGKGVMLCNSEEFCSFQEISENVIEVYKNHKIVDTNNVIEVVSESGTRFIVGLDDSKDCGHRKTDESCNNVESARKYIDWVVKQNS